MTKRFFSLLLTVCVLSFAKAQDYYWVFFADKAGSTFNPYEYFDAKAIERYRMNGVSLYDSTNFPLNGGYVSQVEGVCEDFVGESRWLNAVGVGATPEQIAAIAELPFVTRVIPISQPMEYAQYDGDLIPRDSNLWSSGVTPQLRRMKGERFVEKGIDGTGLRIAVFDGGNHLYAPGVFAALIFGRKKVVHKVEGKAHTHHARAEAKDVGIVMLTGEAGAEGVRTASGADALVLVGHERHTDARAANEDAERRFALLDSLAKAVGENRIVTALQRVVSDVDGSIAELFEVLDHLKLQLIACVIRADQNVFVFHNISSFYV